MDDKKQKKLVVLNNVQAYIYLGYVFLLLLGVANDAIFYKRFDVNIIAYSNILDVLISPLVQIVERPILLVVISILPIIGFFYAKWIHHLENKKRETPEPFKLNFLFVIFVGFLNLCAFIGLGIGKGRNISEKIEANKLKPNHIIEFRDLGQKKVTLVGSNSAYIFYFEQGDSTMSISPIQENVLKMEKLKE